MVLSKIIKRLVSKKSQEYQYTSLIKRCIKHGADSDDRTGVGTKSLFGEKLEFDISSSIPVMTTRKTAFKTCIKELLWMLRGQTDANILKKEKCFIWNGNTTREFLDKRGLQHLPEGDIGALYSFQLRHFGAEYKTCNDDYTGQGFDQLAYVINEIKTNPTSRRILFTYWNPVDLDKGCLTPCFPENSKVLTQRGYIDIQLVELGELVYTHEGNWKEVKELIINDYTGEMTTLTFWNNSKDLETTSNHPFYVKKVLRDNTKTIIGYSNPFWENAEELIKNEYVVGIKINTAEVLPEFSIVYNNTGLTKTIMLDDENMWFSMGYFLGDGWLDRGKNRHGSSLITFSINEKQKNNILSKLKSLNDKFTITDRKNNNFEASFGSKLWYKIFEDFGEKACGKKIPEWVQDAPKRFVKCFLDGYMSADGCVVKDIRYDKEYLNSTTVSYDIAYGIQRLYAKIGIISSVTYQKRPPTCVIQGRIVNQKNTFQVKTSLNTDHKKHKNASYIDEKEGFLWFSVRSVKKENKSLKVYNFEIEEDNSYVIQNISVHNCHHTFQFNVENGVLSGCLYQRSTDTVLGLPFNIIFYSTLIYMMSHICNLKPGKFVHFSGNAHVYNTHIKNALIQVKRKPFSFPQLKPFNKEITDISQFQLKDFELINYMYHEPLKYNMAI